MTGFCYYGFFIEYIWSTYLTQGVETLVVTFLRKFKKKQPKNILSPSYFGEITQMTKNKNKINLFNKSFLLFKLIVDWKKIIVGTIVTNKNVTIHCKLFQGSLSFKVHSEHFNWSLEETLGGETDIFVFSVVDLVQWNCWTSVFDG